MIELAAPVNGYEEGLEAGKKVAGKYRPPATSRIEKWREAAQEAPIRLGGQDRIEEVRAALRPVTQEDLLAYAAASIWTCTGKPCCTTIPRPRDAPIWRRGPKESSCSPSAVSPSCPGRGDASAASSPARTAASATPAPTPLSRRVTDSPDSPADCVDP